MIIVIYFNVFYVTCLSPKKNRNCVRETKTVARETSLVTQKHRMSIYATRACRRPKHKNNVFGRHGLLPKKSKTEFGRHKFVARATTMSPKNTETMLIRHEGLSLKNAGTVFVRQAHTNTANL